MADLQEYRVTVTEETVWMVTTAGGPARALDCADVGIYDSDEHEDMQLVQAKVKVYEIVTVLDDVIDAEILNPDGTVWDGTV